MRSLVLALILIQGFMSGMSQQVFTVRILDSGSNHAVGNAKVIFKGQVLASNNLGFFQVSGSVGDTVSIMHGAYEDAQLLLPNEVSLLVKLTKKDASLTCSWSKIDYTRANYFYSPIEIISPKIKEETSTHLTLSNGRRAFLIINSRNTIISTSQILTLNTEKEAVTISASAIRKETFLVLPDKVNRERYFTLAALEKGGVAINVFEVDKAQIKRLKKQKIHSIGFGNELVVELDDLTGKKLGNMFDCVEF